VEIFGATEDARVDELHVDLHAAGAGVLREHSRRLGEAREHSRRDRRYGEILMACFF
jgi:hypothetical protein